MIQNLLLVRVVTFNSKGHSEEFWSGLLSSTLWAIVRSFGPGCYVQLYGATQRSFGPGCFVQLYGPF